MSTEKRIFYSICLVSFVGPFLSTSINIAIPVMAGQFGVAPDRMSWVVTIFLMTTAAFLLPLGKVSDVHGRRRTYSLSLIVFAMATAAAAFAQTLTMLIILRAIQGIALSGVYVSYMPLLLATTDEAHQGHILGRAVALTYLGLSLGPDPKAFDVISLEYRNPDHTVLAMDYTVSARSADLYSARLEVRRDAAATHDLSLNWMKDSGKFTAVLQRLNPDKSSWGSASLSANIKQKDKVTELQLEKLSIVEGSSLQDVSLKGVSLLFNEAAQFPALANFTEITSMSEEQIETVFEDVQETFKGLLGGLFSSFGTK